MIEAKIAALWDLGIINHFSFDPMDTEDDESILIASKGSSNESTINWTMNLIVNSKDPLGTQLKMH